jgi:hypothetical protein
MSVLASNICVIQLARGICDDAISWGELSVSLGEASKTSVLQMMYTNLVDAYVLAGREGDAVRYMERAREWLVPRRRWKFHCAFLMVNAAFALIQGNVALALECVDRLETIARGREDAVPIPGSYWKLRIFKAAHRGTAQEAARLVKFGRNLFRDCPIHDLEILAAKAWLELRTYGKHSAATMQELSLFETRGALGRKALLAAQGFLNSADSNRHEDFGTQEFVQPRPPGETRPDVLR